MHTVMNSAGEIEEYTTGKAPDRPELASAEEQKAKAADKSAEETNSEKEEGEAPEFAKRLGLTPEQHKSITEIIKREVGKKHRQTKEAEEFAASQYNERRLAEQRAEQAERERDEARKAAQPPRKEAEEPKREAFADDTAYENALLDWKVDQRFRAREAEEAKQRESDRQAKILKDASERIARALELVPDFREVTEAAEEIIPSHIAAYMQESELFAELGYHFAKHPEDLAKVAAMPSRTNSDLVRVGVALDKIESMITPFAPPAKVNGDSKPTSTNGTKPNPETGSIPSQPRVAAPVIQPLSVGSTSQVDKPASRMNYEETRAAWEKKAGTNFSRRSRH